MDFEHIDIQTKDYDMMLMLDVFFKRILPENIKKYAGDFVMAVEPTKQKNCWRLTICTQRANSAVLSVNTVNMKVEDTNKIIMTPWDHLCDRHAYLLMQVFEPFLSYLYFDELILRVSNIKLSYEIFKKLNTKPILINASRYSGFDDDDFEVFDAFYDECVKSNVSVVGSEYLINTLKFHNNRNYYLDPLTKEILIKDD